MMHRFPTRAAALRSLKDISVEAIQHAKCLITEEDGMFCFDEDAAEQYLDNQTETQENNMTANFNVKTATLSQLVEFYNDHAESSIKKFRDRASAERRCQEIVDAIAAEEAKKPVEVDDRTPEERKAVFDIFAESESIPVTLPVTVQPTAVTAPAVPVADKSAKVEGERAHSATQADTMKTTLKLDRTIIAAPAGEAGKLGEWKNAFQMWKEHSDWMSSSQQDTLTAKLYKAAKEGVKLVVTINGRDFWLKNV